MKKELTNISEKSLMELEDVVNEEMLTTEDVNNMLEHTDKGRTKQTIRNCVTVLQNDPVLEKAIKRNELSGRMDIVKEVPWERRNNSPTVTDTDENNLKMYLEENYELTSERVIKAGIDIVSNENKYHPIRDYLESLVWDRIPRIENMLPHFLGAEKSKYTIGVMKMHMLAAISRIYEPGIKYDIMLCLVGSQGAGKSTFFKYLAIKEEWFSDNLDHLDDENIYRKLQNHWIIEMGEMKATITAKNIEQIKSFLSRQKETYKVPYEVHPEDRPRQCVFCGTSNDLNFLPLDRTGNRRFAPVMTDMSKAEVHILDNEAESKAYIEQAWAEAMVLYRQGNVFLGFTKEIEEEAKRLQKEFMPEDTNAGIIQAFLDDYDDDYVCTRILFDEALHRTGEKMCIRDRTGIEMFRKLLDEAQAGDNIGALLRGIKREDVERGQVLTAPGTVTCHTKFTAQVYVLTKDEGGRHTPFFNNYRPQFYFRTTDVTGVCNLPEGTEMCMPGDNVEMTIELIHPIAMEQGLNFAIREGGRTVGSGAVATIIE